jgi:hypothetical protein
MKMGGGISFWKDAQVATDDTDSGDRGLDSSGSAAAAADDDVVVASAVAAVVAAAGLEAPATKSIKLGKGGGGELVRGDVGIVGIESESSTYRVCDEAGPTQLRYHSQDPPTMP